MEVAVTSPGIRDGAGAPGGARRGSPSSPSWKWRRASPGPHGRGDRHQQQEHHRDRARSAGGGLGKPAAVVGNVGRARPRRSRPSPEGVLVVEVSSYQLEDVETFHPRAAALNLTPDHLDRYDSLDHYLVTKIRICPPGAGGHRRSPSGRLHRRRRVPSGRRLLRFDAGRWRTGCGSGTDLSCVSAAPAARFFLSPSFPPGAAQPREFRRRALPTAGLGLTRSIPRWRQPYAKRRAPIAWNRWIAQGVTSITTPTTNPDSWAWPQGIPGPIVLIAGTAQAERLS
jgi:hypothetical protein